MSKNVLAVSAGGHTLRCCESEAILARRGNSVCDGGHSADVMKKGWMVGEDQRGVSPPKPKEGLNGPPAEVI
jgi:hypothetical protein